jgi:uncharacterized membrane protein
MSDNTPPSNSPPIEPAPLSNYLSAFFLLAAAFLLALPVLIHGPMVQGHDTYEHLNFSRHFAEQFWAGEWYPRWLMGMNHGLGSPTLFVYPPLPSYVYTLLYPLGRMLHFNAFNLQEFLALLGSGVAAFLWVGTMASRRVALATAFLYMLMPYHLSIDFYRRTALSESWAFVWMPLVLYFSSPAVARRRGSLAGTAVSYALLILSHLITALIFSPIPVLVSIALSAKGEMVRSTLRVMGAMLLGAGLSCFYLLPAVFSSKYFPVSRLLVFPEYALQDNLVRWTGQVSSTAGRFAHTISLAVLDMIAFVAVCGGAVLVFGGKATRKNVLFWLALSAVPIFLTSSWSLPLWKGFPPLYHALQFPWRFNTILCLASLPIIAAFLSQNFSLKRWYGALSLGLVFLLILTWFASLAVVWNRYKTDSPPAPSLSASDTDGWFDSWSVPGLNQESALKASAGPPVRFLMGDGTASAPVWKPRHIEIQTDSETGGWIMVSQFYYPAWRARLASGGRSLVTKPEMPEGLVALEVPAGSQRVLLDIPIQSAERAGWWIAVFCALICLFLLGGKPGQPFGSAAPGERP